MENTLRRINNVAVSVLAVMVGFKMWFTAEGIAVPVALAIILIGVSALETNIAVILKRRKTTGSATPVDKTTISSAA